MPSATPMPSAAASSASIAWLKRKPCEVSASGMPAASNQASQRLDRAHFIERLAEPIEAFAQLRQQCLPGTRQLEAPRQAPEQPQTEVLFQPLDLVTDRRRRDMQLLGGDCETQMTRRSDEGTQRIQGREAFGRPGF